MATGSLERLGGIEGCAIDVAHNAINMHVIGRVRDMVTPSGWHPSCSGGAIGRDTPRVSDRSPTVHYPWTSAHETTSHCELLQRNLIIATGAFNRGLFGNVSVSR